VLKEGYSHLFFLETDLFPSTQILPLFESFNQPVVCGSYLSFHGSQTIAISQEIKRFFEDGAMVRNYTLLESFLHANGTFRQCYSVGFGCSLIHREVLEKVKFRYLPDAYVVNSDVSDAHADSYFYADLQRFQIPTYLYTGKVIRHYNSDWGKSGLTETKAIKKK
jgi:hypothetical protein